MKKETKKYDFISKDGSILLWRDTLNISCFGAFDITEKPKCVVNVNLAVLKEAINRLDDPKLEFVDISLFGEDLPVLIGKKKVGLLIAPRVVTGNDERYSSDD